MILTRVFPGAPVEIDMDVAASRDTLLEWYKPPSPHWLRLNLIASVDGNAAGSDGTSDSLTNRVDRKILGVIREHSDVVLVGASSVRQEGYLLPRRSRLAVVTASGDLTGHRIMPGPDQPQVIILCPESACDTVRRTLGTNSAEIVTIDDHVADAAAEGGAHANYVSMSGIISALNTLGLTSQVCEGGPRLAGQLIAAGFVDEACFSTSPLVGGTRLPLLEIPSGNAEELVLRHLLIDDMSGVYARWGTSRSSSSRGANFGQLSS